ncbi:MAG: MBL fold metallo-hydrolase RNA specificity domain-containing protein [Anaerolineales bacterium]
MRIFGETYTRRAEVATIGGFSAHAGQTFLVEYAKATRGTAKSIFLVHGEPKPAKALQEELGEVGLSRVYYPELHERVEVGEVK